MRLLLTGASGFLGRHIVGAFSARGDVKLAALVRPHSSLENDKSPLLEKLEYRDFSAMTAHVRGFKPDVIIHLACDYGRRENSLSNMIECNIALGVHLITAASKLNKPVMFFNAGTGLDDGLSLYAAMKRSFVTIAKTFVRPEVALSFCNLELQQFYGRGDCVSKFPSFVFNSLQNNVPEMALTSGTQRRDFIYIDDLVSAIELLVHQRTKLGSFESIEVGTGFAITVREFCETAKAVISSVTHLNFGVVPLREGEPDVLVADTTRLKEFGWEPKTSLISGINRSLEKWEHEA